MLSYADYYNSSMSSMVSPQAPSGATPQYGYMGSPYRYPNGQRPPSLGLPYGGGMNAYGRPFGGVSPGFRAPSPGVGGLPYSQGGGIVRDPATGYGRRRQQGPPQYVPYAVPNYAVPSKDYSQYSHGYGGWGAGVGLSYG